MTIAKLPTIRALVLAILSLGLVHCGGGTGLTGNAKAEKKGDDGDDQETDVASEPANVSGAFLYCDYEGEAAADAETVAVGCAAMSSSGERLSDDNGYKLSLYSGLEIDKDKKIAMTTKRAAAGSRWHVIADLPVAFSSQVTSGRKTGLLAMRVKPVGPEDDYDIAYSTDKLGQPMAKIEGRTLGNEANVTADQVDETLAEFTTMGSYATGKVYMVVSGLPIPAQDSGFDIVAGVAPSEYCDSQGNLKSAISPTTSKLMAMINLTSRFTGLGVSMQNYQISSTQETVKSGACFQRLCLVGETLQSGCGGNDKEWAVASEDGKCLFTLSGDDRLLVAKASDKLTLAALKKFAEQSSTAGHCAP